MNTSPNGIPEHTLPSMDFIFSLQPTFVARGFSGDIPGMVKILTAAIKHRGFAFVDMLQACPTYNRFATHNYLLERCYEPKDHDVHSFAAARTLATDTAERIATGVLYKNEDIPNFYERLVPRQGMETVAVDEVEKQDISGFMQQLV